MRETENIERLLTLDRALVMRVLERTLRDARATV